MLSSELSNIRSEVVRLQRTTDGIAENIRSEVAELQHTIEAITGNMLKKLLAVERQQLYRDMEEQRKGVAQRKNPLLAEAVTPSASTRSASSNESEPWPFTPSRSTRSASSNESEPGPVTPSRSTRSASSNESEPGLFIRKLLERKR